MTDYKILSENISDSLKNKPRWMICVIFIAGLSIMTLSAVGAGIFIGYTYCYVAHRTGLSPINVTQIEKLQMLEVPVGISKENPSRGSINVAILTQIQNILKFGHKILHTYPHKLDKRNEIEM